MTATFVVITRSDGAQARLDRDEPIVSQRGAIRIDDVPRALSEDGGWIEYEDTARDVGGEEWEQDGPCPARIRIYGRGVIETMLLFEAA